MHNCERRTRPIVNPHLKNHPHSNTHRFSEASHRDLKLHRQISPTLTFMLNEIMRVARSPIAFSTSANATDVSGVTLSVFELRRRDLKLHRRRRDLKLALAGCTRTRHTQQMKIHHHQRTFVPKPRDIVSPTLFSPQR